VSNWREDPELVALADGAARFFEREAPPERIAKWRDAGQVERAFWRQAGEAGLLGVSIPAEYGGAGGDFRHDVTLVEQVGRMSSPTAPRSRNAAGCRNSARARASRRSR
jgi:alkylation response protein AidB-like acyl-CoA dehydrogenase